MTERENMLKVLRHEKPDWVPNFGATAAFIYSYGCDRRLDPATGYYKDPFGVKFLLEDGPLGGFMPANTSTGEFELDDVTEWKKMMPKLDLGKVDWKAETEKMINSSRTMYGSAGEDRVFNYVAGYLWDELHYMMGFEEALYSLVAEPEATKEFLCAMANFYVDVIQEQFRYFKPDLALVMDHVATDKGLLMSPQCYREIIKPAQKIVYDCLKTYDVAIGIHVDGRIEELIPDFAELGVTVIQPFQVYNDIEKAKKEYGMAAIGGWDSFGPGNDPNADEETIRASVRKAMDAYAPTGDFAIWFSGAALGSAEKMNWLADEAKKYGRQIYSN